MPIAEKSLLTPQELQRIEHLRLSPGRRFTGRQRGERMSKQKGISIEFSDYREYAIGDDLRHLDWNILARLDRPTIRTYQDEDDLAVYVLLDASASMAFGQPSKFYAAQRLAAAVGFIGLCGQDRVTPAIIGSLASRSLRGRASAAALNRWAVTAEPVGQTSFSAGTKAFLNMRGVRPGLILCITDALDPDASSAIRFAGSRGHEVVVVQVLSSFDINPLVEGDLRLIDSEVDGTVDITATAEAIAHYKSNLTAHCNSLEQSVSAIGGRYVLMLSHRDTIELVTHDLRAIGVIV